MEKKTVWSIFRDLVNSKEIGSIITRQDILVAVERGLIQRTGESELEYLGMPCGFSPVTVDCNRNMAESVGYLAKTDKAGIYRVVEHFDSDYTVSQLRKDYDNGNYCKNQSDK